jgi:predicted nucleic acid-binding protein
MGIPVSLKQVAEEIDALPNEWMAYINRETGEIYSFSEEEAARADNTVLVALDEGLASQSAGLGARHKLRGADAVYLATAALFAAELVTLGREQLERGSSIVQTLTPTGFLSTIKQ